MSAGTGSRPPGDDGGDGKDPTPAGDDGAASDASGYRRDDYWRQAQEGLPADAESEPAHGQDFETPAERARTGDDGAPGTDGAGSGDDSGRTDDTPEHSPPHAK